MSDEDVRRRRAAQHRRRKKARQMKIAAAVIVCLLILCLAVTIALAKKAGRQDPGNASASQNGSGETSVSDDEAADHSETQDGAAKVEPSSDEAQAPDEAGRTPEPAAEKPVITLSESDTRTGDLILVNSSHAYDFEANEATIDLTNIRQGQSFYYQVGNTDMSVAGRILGPLDQLVASCNAGVGTELTGIESASRSLDYQQRVWNEMADLYGTDYAQTYVAAPGYSEHHTGLAVDVGIFYPGGAEGSFSGSDNAAWMNDNSCHYGFVRRYKSDKVDITGISNEAWHFRYVGIPHAVYMTQQNLCLEEYIDYLSTQTSREAPLQFEADGHTYRVWYTAELTFEEPENAYTVSGTNTGGIVVTETVG